MSLSPETAPVRPAYARDASGFYYRLSGGPTGPTGPTGPASGGGGSNNIVIGNVGAGTQVPITHNLGTRDVAVQIVRNSAPYDTVNVGVERTSLNVVTLQFTNPVAANEYRYIILGYEVGT